MKKILALLLTTLFVSINICGQDITSCNTLVLNCSKVAHNFELIDDDNSYSIVMNFLQGGGHWIYVHFLKDEGETMRTTGDHLFCASDGDCCQVSTDDNVQKILFKGRTGYPTRYWNLYFEFATINLNGKKVTKGQEDLVAPTLYIFSPTKKIDDTPENTDIFIINSCSFYKRTDHDMKNRLVLKDYNPREKISKNLFYKQILYLAYLYIQLGEI